MAVAVRIFSDFTCPFCYIGAGMIEELKHEFEIREEWVSYELHPDTPQESVLLAERFPDYDLEGLFEELRIKGEKYGCEFGNVTLLSNSKMALEASEFARDRGKHALFHADMFRAYFGEARDIGQISVVLDVAARVGLDTNELLQALTSRRYGDRLENGRKEGDLWNVSVLPTFIFNEKEKIVGLRSMEIFRQTIKGLAFQPL